MNFPLNKDTYKQLCTVLTNNNPTGQHVSGEKYWDIHYNNAKYRVDFGGEFAPEGSLDIMCVTNSNDKVVGKFVYNYSWIPTTEYTKAVYTIQ